MQRLFHIACFLCPVALLAGCSSSSTPSSAEKLYDLKGKVVSVDAGAKSVKIDHEDVPGLMKAMTMSFAVEDAKLLDGIAAGDAVEGKLKVASDNKYILTELRKTAPAASENRKPADGDDKVKTNLAKLDDEDRKLAEEQRLCPIEDEPLGSMGAPIKLTIKGQSFFICCKGCKDLAEKNADETLKKVAELKKKR
jgi:Cu/Ag efflux protein CusF